MYFELCLGKFISSISLSALLYLLAIFFLSFIKELILLN